MKHISRPKSAAVKDIDINIADILRQKYRIHIGNGNIDSTVSYTAPTRFSAVICACVCDAGWSWECLEDWGPYSRVILSSIFMTVIFWLCTEVGTFLAGLYNVQLLMKYSIQFANNNYVQYVGVYLVWK